MPERIGAYRLESPLGRGGMGEVFLAWDERLERAVAIKRIRHDTFVQSHQRERFRREARMAARLSHAAIVQVHDLVSEESGDAIVMEYVEGPTLAERLARTTLGVAEAVHLAKEIAQGLAAAHEAGLIHRDLKAENVVITPSGHAKILDFGLARPMSWDGEVLTQHGALVGTCYAMSPEQASGGDLDERSDLFSLGALLYEMLAGHSAFRAKDPRATLQRVLYEQPEPLSEILPDLPLTLVSLVERLLAKDRDERPRSAASVAHKLERIERDLPEDEEGSERNDDSVSEMPTYAFPVRPASRPPEPSASKVAGPLRRARGWIYFLAGALVALVIAVTLHYLNDRLHKRAPLRILVTEPAVKGTTDEKLELVATSTKMASLQTLGSMEGLAPFEIVEGASDLREADEILKSNVQKVEGTAYINFQRISREGQVLWSDEFTIPLDPEELWPLAGRINSSLRAAFPNHPVRPGTILLEANSADYAKFIAVLQNIDSGNTRMEDELKNLEQIILSSPRFLDAKVEAVHVACNLYRSSWKSSDLDQANAYLRQANGLAPNDSRTIRARFDVALLGRREEEAQAALEQLAASLPGDPQVLFLTFRLADAQGYQEKAENVLRDLVERTPSWRYRYWLADLLSRRGQFNESRQILDNLHSQDSGNTWVRTGLAYWELVYGSLEEAQRLYSELGPKRHNLTNLGLAQALGNNYLEAQKTYAKALNEGPGQIFINFHLADAQRNLGNTVAAEALYGTVLSQLDNSRTGSKLFPREELMKSQCLVHLGRLEEAKQAAKSVVSRIPDDPLVQRDASMVYIVSGDLPNALLYAKAALGAGLPRRWFEDSAFAPLRQLKEFQDLTAR